MHPICQLIDGWKRHAEAPETFHVPTLKELMPLKPGDHVKIGVEGFEALNGKINGERFWVEITNLTPAPICGIVRQSDMLYTTRHGVADGDTIFFTVENILAIHE